MEDKKSLGDKLGMFLAGKGFYIVLLLCVGLIAASIWLMAHGRKAHVEAPSTETFKETAELPAPTAAPQKKEEPVTWLPSVPAMEPEENSPLIGKPYVPPTAPAAVNPLPAPGEAAEPASQPTVQRRFIWPVSGTVERPYSVDALTYDKTMADWRTHPAMDLKAPVAGEVLSVSDGTVSAVYTDPMLGTVVEIDHGDGLVSVYANLDAETETEVGQKVQTGERIGSVGATAVSESGQGSHLHFAMRQNGQSIDPETILPER